MKRTALVFFGWVAVACGGSSSETPFPQAPIDPELEARHDQAQPPQAEATTASASEAAAVSAPASSSAANPASVSPGRAAASDTAK